MVGASRCRSFGTPLRLYESVVAESAHGTCTQPLQAASWSLVIGASEAPKSAERLVIAEMPPPEPTAAYCS